ncbi:FAD-dependent oxidoreductase [Galbitalea sp. SE-J8]|uniref:NAD(P)/FAD-dependent oxidoreductase n=1 Tax=Galbitalea sp. SE-J8 TaxID=3054952 RepID=UPI00259C6B6F|nr:FAD-dependent oxidoreductase [Galbitalea sp. SE-J8]MDM4762917.1 FAD-dependent oxidoreductase [Galbitalea sp. SE-J8]
MSPTVIVIGAGVAGASTAFALARRGVPVTIVDAALPGRATAAGAGIIQPWTSSAGGEFYRLYAGGAAYYGELLGRLAEVGVDDIGYRRAGSLVVSDSAAALDEVEARASARAADAPAMGELIRAGAGRARELFPPLAPHLAALLVSGGARVDGRALAAGLLAGALRRGAEVLAATARIVSGPGPWRIETDAGPLSADVVVVAAGAWTNGVLGPLGRRVGVEPQRGQITHLRVTADTRQWPTVLPLGGHYLLAFDDSRVVVGATRESGAGFDVRVTAAGQREVLENALRVAPGLADATIIETRVGLRPYPDAELPTVGELSGLGGLYVNAGFGAAGLTMGPSVGERLAAEIVGERAPGAALANVPGR